MTAINIMLTPDGAYLFCDTKMNALGVPMGNAVKCLPIPHINAAIAIRGHNGILPIALAVAANCISFAEMRDRLGPTLREMREGGKRGDAYGAVMEGDFDVFVIGHFNSPVAFAVFSHDKHGYPAWKVMEIPQGIVTPVIPERAMETISREREGVEAVMAIMAVQADIRRDVVGGHIHVTIVAEDGIHTSTLGKLPVPPSMPRQALNAKLPEAFAKHLSPATGR